MAKAKKNESSAPAPKKAVAKKAAPKKATAAGGQPLVDTGLAAQNAAKHLAAGIGQKAAASGGGSGARSESSVFKNLKQGLAKPHLTGLDNLLDKSAPDTKRQNVPFGGGKQVGHNQTFGADVNRAGVPRRTPG